MKSGVSPRNVLLVVFVILAFCLGSMLAVAENYWIQNEGYSIPTAITSDMPMDRGISGVNTSF